MMPVSQRNNTLNYFLAGALVALGSLTAGILGKKYSDAQTAEQKLEGLDNTPYCKNFEEEQEYFDLCHQVNLFSHDKGAYYFFKLGRRALNPEIKKTSYLYVCNQLHQIRDPNLAITIAFEIFCNEPDPGIKTNAARFAITHLDTLKDQEKATDIADFICCTAEYKNIVDAAAQYTLGHLNQIQTGLILNRVCNVLFHAEDMKLRNDAAQYVLDHLDQVTEKEQVHFLFRVTNSLSNPEIRKAAEEKLQNLNKKQSQHEPLKDKDQSMNLPFPSGYLNGRDLDKIIENKSTQNRKTA
jgi:hypothetical protein